MVNARCKLQAFGLVTLPLKLFLEPRDSLTALFFMGMSCGFSFLPKP